MLKKISVLLFAFLLLGATFAEGPRNVRLRFAPQQTSLDSLTFDLRWNAPQPSRGATPIEGYEWEFRNVNSGDTADTVLISGTVQAAGRQVLVSIPVMCGQNFNYQARVRAAGEWVTTAPWGSSEILPFYCENMPPGAPVVTLDTISGGDGG